MELRWKKIQAENEGLKKTIIDSEYRLHSKEMNWKTYSQKYSLVIQRDALNFGILVFSKTITFHLYVKSQRQESYHAHSQIVLVVYWSLIIIVVMVILCIAKQYAPTAKLNPISKSN